MFESTHKLKFTVNPQKKYTALKIIFDQLLSDFKPIENYKQFHVGTVHGLFAQEEKKIKILAIMNDEPGNGHFEDTMQWFEHMATQDKCPILMQEVWNEALEKHLIKKRDYKRIKVGLIKYFH